MKYSDFEREAVGLITPPMATLGFSHYAGAYFKREHAKWWDAFFFDLDRASKDAFTLCVGFHVPAVAERLRRLLPVEMPTLLVGDFLGALPRGKGGSQTWYRFGRSEPLSDAIAHAVDDFRGHAIPWLGRFKNFTDVVAEYRARKIEDPSGHPRKDPMAWAIYGLLLLESENTEEARRWLSMAHDDLSKPLYSADGRRFLTEKIPGARAVPRPPQEKELARLLTGILQGA
jgi:Domain of unknown function (DUF4304)